MIKRTQEQILERFNSVGDIFSAQKEDLICYMTFENAKPFLDDEYALKVERKEEEREMLSDAEKEIVEYLDFAYEKAEGQRANSAMRSMLHFRTWIWLDDPEFYDEIIDEIDNYTNYGIPVLDKISAKYGYVRK